LPGNTLIIGSTGVGKTTFEMFLLTLTRKWNPRHAWCCSTWTAGCEIAIRALGGRYFTLEAGKPTGATHCSTKPHRLACSSGNNWSAPAWRPRRCLCCRPTSAPLPMP